MITAQVDTSVLVQRTRARARVAGLTFPQALKKQAGLLKWDLMKSAPPKNLSENKRLSVLATKKVFFPRPTNQFTGRKAKGNGVRWLYAGVKGGRFLVGTPEENYQPGLGVDELIKINNATQNNRPDRTWFQVGNRGGKSGKNKGNPFHVNLIQKTVVGRQNLKRLHKFTQNQFGLLKASWAFGMVNLGVNKSIPGWIKRHLDSGKAKGKVIGRLHGEKPYIQIISQAKGVEHQKSIEQVRRAVAVRERAILTDMKLYLAGIKKKAGFK